jgi:hypothetical protein
LRCTGLAEQAYQRSPEQGPEIRIVALAVAIFLVHIAPDQIQWLNIIEETWRRWVHSWFLVPDGILKTVGILEDARYTPSDDQKALLPDGIREQILTDLKLPATSTEARWARAQLLMEILSHTTQGSDVFASASFDPFSEDFEEMRARYRALRKDAPSILRRKTNGSEDVTSDEDRDAFDAKVKDLLRRIYTYISWGVLYGAQSEHNVDQKLQDFGFSIPPRGGRRMFDIVAPAGALVAVVTMLFRLLTPPPGADLSDRIINALTAALANGLMYGFAVYFALQARAATPSRRGYRARGYSPVSGHGSNEKIPPGSAGELAPRWALRLLGLRDGALGPAGACSRAAPLNLPLRRGSGGEAAS